MVSHGKAQHTFGPWKDTFERTGLVAARAPMELTAAAPILVTATDIDWADHDFIGTAEVTLADVLKMQKGTELSRPLMNGAAVTGSVRLRIDVVAAE